MDSDYMRSLLQSISNDVDRLMFKVGILIIVGLLLSPFAIWKIYELIF
jgi:hypothetical protein